MKIEDGNANKTTRIDKRFSISLILALVIFMISGSAATMSYAAPQTLPSCTDPTGQNLRCMMVISTLPPPPNALQCQVAEEISQAEYAHLLQALEAWVVGKTILPHYYTSTRPADDIGHWCEDVQRQVQREIRTQFA